ncbi:MAG: hypothetical protein Q7U72_08240 [Brevundimonas sp.]|uniref:hypothetical protein n=1 Tax=Brevundimonas sp. TaxID=1871086 RepID=UPI002720A3AB|nr:hypothetical protein [Brevundimonas sp.]MDO9077424.1 hypothetical protein [Brevundimonas sp.]MDP3080343.1 hypothetical protein [Brevundimonas sp.]MDZ4062672.1 hypothetical protein [Brevundimonas sp.]
MDPISILSGLGLGVAGNAVYDYLKARLTGPNPPTVEQLEQELQNIINVNGVTMQASTVIEALAKNGVITITRSHLNAPSSISIGAVNGRAYFGDNSSSTTATTAIHAGEGASIQFSGNAKIVQAPDGSIRFYT